MPFVMDVVKVDIPGSTTPPQDIALSLGGQPPDGIIVIASGANGDNVNNIQALMGFGFSDMTTDQAVAWHSQDGSSTGSLTWRRSFNKIVTLNSSSGTSQNVYAEATVSGSADDEVTLTWTTVNTGRLTIIAFAGATNAAVGTDAIPTTDNATSEVALGFTPNCVFGLSCGDNWEAGVNNARPSFGMSCFNGSTLKAGGLGFCSSKNDTPSALGSYFGSFSNKHWLPMFDNTPNFDGVVEMTSYTIGVGSGFTVTTRNAGGGGMQSGMSYAYLALEIPDDALDMIETAMPSSTGEDTETFNFSGFFPQGVIGLFSAAPARDTAYLTTDAGNVTGGQCIWAHNGTVGRTIQSTDENDQTGNTNCNQQVDDNLKVRTHDETVIYDATFTEFVDAGVKQNYSVANGSDHMAILLGIRGDAVPSGGGGQLVDNNPLLGHNLIGGKLVA